jgi:hypothetical protein
MLVFPQLVTGASSIYPLRKQHNTRTAVNDLGDGKKVVYEDADAATVEWELRLKGLTRADADAIETLFDAVSGQWGTFTFLDPGGNLLAQSEAFTNTVWTNGPLLQVTAGVADPNGGTGAFQVVNQGPAGQMVAQALDAPGNFQYSVSVWARSTSGSGISLGAQTTGGSVSGDFQPDTTWRRFSLPVNLGQTTATVTFGVSFHAGASVELFGMQVEAQPGASDYKHTGAHGGVYSNARFASDSLTMRAQGTDIFDAVIRIIAPEN